MEFSFGSSILMWPKELIYTDNYYYDCFGYHDYYCRWHSRWFGMCFILYYYYVLLWIMGFYLIKISLQLHIVWLHHRNLVSNAECRENELWSNFNSVCWCDMYVSIVASNISYCIGYCYVNDKVIMATN